MSDLVQGPRAQSSPQSQAVSEATTVQNWFWESERQVEGAREWPFETG